MNIIKLYLYNNKNFKFNQLLNSYSYIGTKYTKWNYKIYKYILKKINNYYIFNIIDFCKILTKAYLFYYILSLYNKIILLTTDKNFYINFLKKISIIIGYFFYI